MPGGEGGGGRGGGVKIPTQGCLNTSVKNHGVHRHVTHDEITFLGLFPVTGSRVCTLSTRGSLAARFREMSRTAEGRPTGRGRQRAAKPREYLWSNLLSSGKNIRNIKKIYKYKYKRQKRRVI